MRSSEIIYASTCIGRTLAEPRICALLSAIAERHRIPRNKVLVRFGFWPERDPLNKIIRKASVHWKGEATCSSKTVTTGSGVLPQTGVSSDVLLQSNSEADPPELIAAAHVSSFSLALSDELGALGFTEGEIVSTATLTLEQLPAGWTIAKVNLNVVAKLPGVTQAEFIDATIRAKTTCMVARSLRANISMTAKLEN